jgi:hypothetical protein
MKYYLAWISLLMAYGAYMMVWISTPLAGLSFNAYDLADWVVIYPPTPNRPDSFLLAIGLRLLPILLIWLGCFYIQGIGGIRYILGMGLIGILMLSVAPPPELLTDRHNPDHIQRLQLFIVMLVGSGIILSGFITPFKKWFFLILGIIGVSSSIWSILQIQTLFIDNSMPVSIGFSAFLFPVLLLASMAWNLKWQS